ncbi:tetratricopeptide repeat protein [Simplicispira metamorpha]|uniref:protein O-GlcNAc transferase n=1 Tax=Simplicispira metamorpha TaxID=80881 RepID=A0A4R2N3I0_9BURK|nr:tetratricopeptide repeat protein [Simplicispira metamorpha]TCP14451.1 putative O-linked N-acetylglucosamine transferase (SPINDLY family) [Simplicispira metamorpha]
MNQITVVPARDPSLEDQLSAEAAEVLRQTMDLALQCHHAKDWEQAAMLYQVVLRLLPEHADANHNLGAILVEQGSPLEAIPFFQRALQANPRGYHYWVSLVDALMLANEYALATDILEDARRAGLAGDAAGELVERLVAHAAQKKASVRIGREPPAKLKDEITRLYNEEKFNEVVTLGRKLVKQFPASNLGYKSLGAALMRLGQREKAEPYMLKVLERDPTDIDILSNYGLLLAARGELVQAEVLLRRALHKAPGFMQAWFNLGIVMRGQARLEAAERAYRSALEIEGHNVGVLLNYSLLLTEMNRFIEAEQCIRKAIALKPDLVNAYVGLGILLKDQGHMHESIAALRQAIEVDPQDPSAHSTLLFVINCIPEMDPYERFAAYQEFNRRFAEPFHKHWRAHTNDRSTARRLRVGYVAPVFRTHSCVMFLEPLLAQHDHERVELFAYAEQYELEDVVTDRYRTYFEHWRDTKGISDDQLAALIRHDQIDVLIDIAGQTRGHRLGAFARKPAPVSLHWLDSGYTTGLTAIDYYLTDAATAPVGCESLFSETPWRLPRAAFVYRPLGYPGEVNALPALERGYVTFGTLTRAMRLNQRLIAAWARLLNQVPNSHLAINSNNFSHPQTRELWLQRFEDLGIARERLEIGYQSPPWDVLRGMDIALDCFPQNSGTTLLESLYMGLPFVTLAGTPSMGTLGASVLTGLGRPEWIAHSEDEYVDKLVALASDLPALATIRAGLRQEMQASAVMDESGFARDVEDAYFAMFQKWAETHPEGARP